MIPDTSTDADSNARTELHDLDREECLTLLAGHHLGRLAVGMGDDAPLIRPVNYVFDDSSKSVAFRTGYGSKLHALRHATKAAFEIDGVDSGTRSGWSVIISGVTEEVTNAAEVQHLDSQALETWAPGDRPHWVRIRAFRVSGRRLVRISG